MDSGPRLPQRSTGHRDTASILTEALEIAALVKEPKEKGGIGEARHKLKEELSTLASLVDDTY